MPDDSLYRFPAQLESLAAMVGLKREGRILSAIHHPSVVAVIDYQKSRDGGCLFLNWLPEAEITLEREEDVLHIRTQGELSPVEMRAHLEPYGIQLAAFLKDGVPLAGTVDEGKTLPWLSDLERGAELGPEEIAARKDAWVLDHPEEYLRLLNSAPTTPEPR